MLKTQYHLNISDAENIFFKKKLLVEILVKTVLSFKANMYDNPHINMLPYRTGIAEWEHSLK